MRSLPYFMLLACTLVTGADAQHLSQPVYRVANSPEPVVQAGMVDQAIPSAPVGGALFDPQVMTASTEAPAGPLDLTQIPGEHPLMPCLRSAKESLQRIEQQVQDYTATFTKVERLDGALGDPQQMQLRVRHQPFSVYMKFVQPMPGQEVLYVANQNNGKLVALASGWKRRIGKLNLDPNGTMAMRGQRHPITKSGIRNLTAELIKTAESDTKYAECDVTHNPSVKIDGRAVTMIEVTHPVPRKNFKYHKARIFIDNEYRFPVAYEAYSWPLQEGGNPVLEERYIYTDIRLNNGFTDEDFSADNPALFN